MITFTPIDGTCKVQSGSGMFHVFPSKPEKDTWTLLSHPEEELVNTKWISWPGEYDFSGITLRAIGQEQGKQVSYAATTEGIRMAFVDTPVLAWNDKEIEKLGDIDVLVIAADDPKKVLALVEDVDPRVIILIETPKGDLAAVAKACGQTSPESVDEFKVKPGSLPQDSRQVVVLG